MPLASAMDYTCIGGWNLSKDFTQMRDRLLEVAKIAYKMLAASGRPPQPAECEDTVTLLLHGSSAFGLLMQAASISYDFVAWDMLAGSIARILLDEEFDAI